MKNSLENSVTNEYNRILAIKGLVFETADLVYDMMNVPFHAFTKFLALKKNREDNGTAIVLRDLEGNFILAGIVKYHEPEREDQAGNWSYEYTFNEEDIKESTNYNVTDSSFIEVLQLIAIKHNLTITEMDFAIDLVLSFFTALINVLKQNASSSEECEIEHDGYFVAVSVVENDEVLLSLTPDGAMKRLIKDDTTLEETI